MPIMIVGEAPGEDEDIQGRPFCGRAGQILTKALEKAGIRREDVYITNTVKCRPPLNRTPSDEEINSCSEILFEEIEKLKPAIIIALGNTAAKFLTGMRGVSKLRNKVFFFRDVPVIVTYHPAYFLHKKASVEEKLEYVADFSKALALLKDMDKFKFLVDTFNAVEVTISKRNTDV